MTQKDYFKNRGDEYGKKLAVGMEAAEKDGFVFKAQTAVMLGAKPDHAERVEYAIANDYRHGLSGFEYLIQDDSDEIYGYVSQIVSAEQAQKDAQENWFLNHPSA